MNLQFSPLCSFEADLTDVMVPFAYRSCKTKPFPGSRPMGRAAIPVRISHPPFLPTHARVMAGLRTITATAPFYLAPLDFIGLSTRDTCFSDPLYGPRLWPSSRPLVLAKRGTKLCLPVNPISEVLLAEDTREDHLLRGIRPHLSSAAIRTQIRREIAQRLPGESLSTDNACTTDHASHYRLCRLALQGATPGLPPRPSGGG